MIPIRQAQARLCEAGASFRCADFAGNCVLLHTHDSMAFYENAIAKRYGDWILVWTEHNGYHLAHQDDVIKFLCLKKQKCQVLWTEPAKEATSGT